MGMSLNKTLTLTLNKKLIKYKKLSKLSSKVTQHQKRCEMRTHKNSLKAIKANMIKQGMIK